MMGPLCRMRKITRGFIWCSDVLELVVNIYENLFSGLENSIEYIVMLRNHVKDKVFKKQFLCSRDTETLAFH